MMVLATRCPHCETVFRVQESQLARSRGLVRCGHCQEVFNSSDNLLDPNAAMALGAEERATSNAPATAAAANNVAHARPAVADTFAEGATTATAQARPDNARDEPSTPSPPSQASELGLEPEPHLADEASPEPPQADLSQAELSQAEPPQAAPPQAEPPQAEPPQAEPPQAELPQAEPPQAEPPQAAPPQAELPQAELPQAELSQAELPQAEPPQAELSQTELSQADLSQAEPPQAEPPQAEPPQAEPPQTEPPQAAPPQTEPPQAEPPQAELSQAELSQAELSQAEPPQAEPPQAELSQAELSQAELSQAEPPQAELSQTEPPQTELSQAEPPQAAPPQAEPPQAELSQAEPPQAEPPQAEPPQAAPPQAAPPQTEPPQTEPPQTEPPQTEPPQTEPPQTEPPQAEQSLRPAAADALRESSLSMPKPLPAAPAAPEPALETTRTAHEVHSWIPPDNEPTMSPGEQQPVWHADPEPGGGVPPAHKIGAGRAARPTPFDMPPSPTPDDRVHFALTRERRTNAPRHTAWRILGVFIALVLVTALAAQLAWWRRETVMAYWPNSQPLFASVCARLGCHISPPRDIDGLQVEASDLRQIDGPHRLELRVPLRNRYNIALALPAIELTLYDEHNEVSIRRVLWPQDYVPPGTVVAAGLPPLSRQTMIVRLDTGNVTATNFRVQIFYP